MHGICTQTNPRSGHVSACVFVSKHTTVCWARHSHTTAAQTHDSRVECSCPCASHMAVRT